MGYYGGGAPSWVYKNKVSSLESQNSSKLSEISRLKDQLEDLQSENARLKKELEECKKTTAQKKLRKADNINNRPSREEP